MTLPESFPEDQRDRRLRRLAALPAVNGVEYVEYSGIGGPTLLLRLLRPPGPWGPRNVRILGGERIRGITAVWVAPGDTLPADADPALVAEVDDPATVLVVRCSTRGDFSRYRLVLVDEDDASRPPTGVDPVLAAVDVWFRLDCDAALDPAEPGPVTSPPPAPPVAVDYLVKDFWGFRRLMLDRMALLAPAWTERDPADIGVMLVEILAHVADGLSYRQDAISTEAYLPTARRRVSLRRLARLVDHVVSEGRAARAWLHVEGQGGEVVPAGTPVTTAVPGFGPVVAPDRMGDVLASGPVVFETLDPLQVDPAMAALRFHTWTDGAVTLPAGSTSATVVGAPEGLVPGVVLILVAAAADPDGAGRWQGRQAIRLTGAVRDYDPIGPTEVTRIAWDPADALRRDLVLVDDAGRHSAGLQGNVVAAEHGHTTGPEELPAVGDDRYRPTLRGRPVTRVVPPPPPTSPASALAEGPGHDAIAAVIVRTGDGGRESTWRPVPDLLGSAPSAQEFTVETEHDGTTTLRFGDGEHGRRLPRGVTPRAVYRVGNGTTGNVGAHALVHLVLGTEGAVRITNPLPAEGGADPDTAERIRREAPAGLGVQERAVTVADWSEVAVRDPAVQRAVASFRWTGSWYTTFLTVDPLGGADLDAPTADRLRRRLERYRLAGYDLAVEGPHYVALELALTVSLRPGHFAADVTGDVRAVLRGARRPKEPRGLFDPDRLSFGDRVALSSVYAAVSAVPGVESVIVTTFRRYQDPESSGVDTGELLMGRLEVPRLDDDPDFPEHGVLSVAAGETGGDR